MRNQQGVCSHTKAYESACMWMERLPFLSKGKCNYIKSESSFQNLVEGRTLLACMSHEESKFNVRWTRLLDFLETRFYDRFDLNARIQ